MMLAGKDLQQSALPGFPDGTASGIFRYMGLAVGISSSLRLTEIGFYSW
jgi:hypothetical protein